MSKKKANKKANFIENKGSYSIRENKVWFIPAIVLIASSVIYAIVLKNDSKDGFSTGESVCAIVCVLSFLGGIYIFIKAARRRITVGANYRNFCYVPAIGRSREITSAELAKIEMDLPGSRMDLIDKSGNLFVRITNDMPEIDRLYEEIKDTALLKYEEGSEKNRRKIYRGKMAIISFAITAAYISVASIFLSSSLYHAVYFVVPLAGIVLYYCFGRYFIPEDDEDDEEDDEEDGDDLDWPSGSLWIAALAIGLGVGQSTMMVNHYLIAFILVIFSLICVLILKGRITLRKADKWYEEVLAIVALSIAALVIAFVMTSGINYTFAKTETIYATVVDKIDYEEEGSGRGYDLVVSNKKANLYYESVAVYWDTYENTEIGDVFPVELRQSLFNITNIQAPERNAPKLFSDGILGSYILANLVILGAALALGIIQSTLTVTGFDFVFVFGIISMGICASCVYTFLEKEPLWITIGLGIFGLASMWTAVYFLRIQFLADDEEDYYEEEYIEEQK